jgi:hypothetical protein
MAEAVAAPEAGLQTAGGTALGLKKESSHPGRCERAPEGVWLKSDDGLVVRLRCGCVNKCNGCAQAKAWESAEMLMLDALNGEAPSVWACLGTRETTPEPARFYRARELVIRALRRRWPDVEYVAKFEMTTGYGARSGGKRRPHWHLLIKGVPREHAQEAFEIAARVWCGHVDAEIGAQRGGEITAAPGLIRYITAHFSKESQRPPAGWKGQREVRSHGYLWLPAAEAREAARESIARRRALHRAKEAGSNAHDAELAAELEMRARAARRWRIVFGDGSDESHFLYEAERIRGRLGSWRTLRGEPATSLVRGDGSPRAPSPKALERVSEALF